MVEWAATRDRLYGFGDSGTVTLGVEEWRPGGDAPPLPESADAIAVGETTEIECPTDRVLVAGTGRTLPPGALESRTHQLRFGSELETSLAFEGPATVEDTGRYRIQFPAPTPVAIGFNESPRSRPSVRVPKTPDGIATAVTAAGGTHRTAGPERSHPGFRPRTPRVTFGEQSVPDVLALDDDSPVMTVPDSTTAVLAAAPLAYYLGAQLRTGTGDPVLRADETEHRFEPLPTLAEEISEALQRLCYLDSQLRAIDGADDVTAGEYDRDSLRAAAPAERFTAALEADFETLPTWPLSVYVDDNPANGHYLPYLLDRLSLVHPACASKLNPQAFLKRCLDEFYRGESPTVEAVDPALSESHSHAWLGEGTPVDAYTLLGTDSATAPSGKSLSIDVVCNEPEMAAEQDVTAIYERRLAGHDTDIRVHERLSVAELATVFENATDLVHFIGHCEKGGIVCPDGALAAADLQTCAAGAVFLNACGSYYEGYDLVRQGAAVSGVTLSAVLDEQALTVGTTFAELLASGFTFDHALALARGEIIVGRDYVVVGDGTHRLRAPCGTPGVFSITDSGREYTVEYDTVAPDAAGRSYIDPFDGETRLYGETATATLEADSLLNLLERFSLPARYGGELRWSGELAEHIRRTESYS